nr:DNA-directed DNA polymerase [Tanacetum cinerariifolium]
MNSFPPQEQQISVNEIFNFQQRFDESFHEGWDRYKDLLRACPHHGFTELYQLDSFYNALNLADQDSLNAAAGGNLLERRTQDVLAIIENKSKVRNSRNKSVVSQVKSCDANSNSSSEISKPTHAVNQQTSAVTTAMTAILKQFQATPPPAFVKAVEEICVTCGGAHLYYQCLATGGNTFPELRDNIQGYVAVAATTIRANMKAMQTQINNVKNELRNEMKNSILASMSNITNELKNMMVSFFQMNIASTSRLGSLHSNTVANPKGELKAITTRSGIVLDGPFVPIPPSFINPEEDERVEETLTDQDLAGYTIKLHINTTLADALILMPKYQKMLKALLSNKEKLQELENTPLNENCLAVILKKLPEKLGDPGKFLILCGFSLPELISTSMTLELANRAICTPAGIARDVFISVGKFTFPTDFVIVDYESDARVPLILGRPFLRTPRALIDVHGEDMILRDGDERLTLNMRHDTSSYSNQPQKESINLINVFNDSSEYFLEDLFSTNQPSGNPTSHPIFTSPEVKDDIFDSEGSNVLPKKLLDLDSTKDLHSLLHFDIESDLKEIEYLVYHDLIKDLDSILKDSIDQSNLADLNNNLVDSMPKMFTDEHALNYSSPPLLDEYDDDLFKVEFDTENVYDDPFDSKGEKIKESKLLIDELDLPCDFLPSSEYDSFISKDFSRVDALPSTNNEDKVFNPGILFQENPFEIITRVAKHKKLAISNASSMLEDFDPPLYELPFFKKVPRSKMLLLFLFENEEKVFKPRIHTSEKVHSSLITKLSHQGYKVFKINLILKSPMKIFLFSYGKDTHI